MKNILTQNQNLTNRWIITYADFITMLLALFMVMYALLQMDISNMKEFSQSVGDAFRQPVQENAVENKSHLQQIFETTQTSVSFSTVDTSSQEAQVKTLKKQLSEIEPAVDREAIEFENIKSIVNKKLNKVEGVSITREPRGLRIRLNNTILFNTGSDIIRADSIVLLDKIAEALKNVPNPIRIEGHTDNIPIKTAKFPSNWELSTARATNIIRHLIKKHDFSPEKLSAIGYGEFKPVENNNSKEGRANNRRVDIVILSESSKIFSP